MVNFWFLDGEETGKEYDENQLNFWGYFKVSDIPRCTKQWLEISPIPIRDIEDR